jgi:hypothetical protein
MPKPPEPDPGIYQLESSLNAPVLWYHRPAIGEERFSEKTLEFFRRNEIDPNNPDHRPESLWVTYRISPEQKWQDQRGITHTGFCTCKGFSIRKKCRHLTQARQLLQEAGNSPLLRA